jgi:hypothetical protein
LLLLSFPSRGMITISFIFSLFKSNLFTLILIVTSTPFQSQKHNRRKLALWFVAFCCSFIDIVKFFSVEKADFNLLLEPSFSCFFTTFWLKQTWPVEVWR